MLIIVGFGFGKRAGCGAVRLLKRPVFGTVRRNNLEVAGAGIWFCNMPRHSPFRYFKTSPEIIRLAVLLYIRFPLSLRNVEDLLHERGIEICHETVRY